MSDSGDERRGLRDDRGQLAPLGVALISVIVIIGTVGIVVLGGAALTDTQSHSDRLRAEHVLTLFDSRAAMVALGDSDAQTTSLSGDGSYRVVPNSGVIKIVHSDYNNSADETIYNDTMGALVYESDGTTIAYQGGGVWRQNGDAAARMVTPPEFYYRQSTLTFPLIRVANSDSAAGSPRAEVRATQRAHPIYPNRSAGAAPVGSDEVGAPYDPVAPNDYEEPYANPLENGSLVVWITSDYYEGWADYFQTQTDAKVTTFDGNDTVKADLVSLGNRGRFPMPQEGNGIRVAGLSGDDHNLENLTLVLQDDPDDDANFNNLQWSMYVDNGQREFEMNLRKGGTIDGDRYLELNVYYSDDNGNTYHGWENNTAFKIREKDLDDDGDDDKYAIVNMTSTSTDLTYASFSSSEMTHFDNPDSLGDWSGNDTGRWANHSSVSYENPHRDFSPGDEMPASDVTAHYLSIVGEEYQFRVDDKQSQTVHESSSYGDIEYPGSAQYIAYLHVTENEIEIELE